MGPHNCSVAGIFCLFAFFHRRKKVLQVWNDIRVWCVKDDNLQNVNFWVNLSL